MALAISRNTSTTFLQRAAAVCLLLCANGLVAQTPNTYYEFGTVLAVGQNTIDLETYSQDAHGLIRQTFVFTPETRADLVRLGDQVEVIYTPAGDSLQLRRLLSLAAGIPRFGPPPPVQRAAEPAQPASTPPAQVAVITPAPVVRTPRRPNPRPG